MLDLPFSSTYVSTCLCPYRINVSDARKAVDKWDMLLDQRAWAKSSPYWTLRGLKYLIVC